MRPGHRAHLLPAQTGDIMRRNRARALLNLREAASRPGGAALLACLQRQHDLIDHSMGNPLEMRVAVHQHRAGSPCGGRDQGIGERDPLRDRFLELPCELGHHAIHGQADRQLVEVGIRCLARLAAVAHLFVEPVP